MFVANRSYDGLNEQVQELWDTSLFESTKTTYKAGLNCLLRFMHMNRFSCVNNILPKIEEDFLIYLVNFCRNTLNLKHDTIKLYLAGIRLYYICDGLSYPDKCIRIPFILRDIKKSQQNIAQKRMPITASVLNNMCRYLALGVFSPFTDLMLLCIFKMAFFGFLRCGEFTCRSTNESSHFLRMQDISVDPLRKYFVIYLRASKCDPFR